MCACVGVCMYVWQKGMVMEDSSGDVFVCELSVCDKMWWSVYRGSMWNRVWRSVCGGDV